MGELYLQTDVLATAVGGSRVACEGWPDSDSRPRDSVVRDARRGREALMHLYRLSPAATHSGSGDMPAPRSQGPGKWSPVKANFTVSETFAVGSVFLRRNLPSTTLFTLQRATDELVCDLTIAETGQSPRNWHLPGLSR